MKFLVIILNVLLLITSSVVLAEEGWDSEVWFLILLLFVVPISTLFYVVKNEIKNEHLGLLGLYLERKSLEQKTKIKELKKDLADEKK
jgi:hypothetical protein